VAWIILIPLWLVGPGTRDEPLFSLELVTDALNEPVGIVGDPGDPSRLLVVERSGQLVVVDHHAVRPEPLLDLTGEVESGGAEQGLLGIALDPAFAETGRLFLYETDRNARMVVLEFAVSPDLSAANAASRREIIAIPDPDPFHNGGQLLFGPDQRLYVGVGDGGLLQGGWRDGRDPGSLLGKLLRLDVDSDPGPGLGYAIPADNPFVGVDGARGEVWAIGLRNPWRFAFDSEAGDLWVADVGQVMWEEVNRIAWTDAAGANFGWNETEGPVCFQAGSCDRSGLVAPIAVYQHRRGNCAVIGGLVYHGPVERLEGQYLMGDYCSGRVWTISPGERDMILQEDTDLVITTFGTGADGSAYVASQDGRLMKIVPGR
jgi:glucose/arabinose dehydrogenase